jgi:Uma2 family endonuclease
MATREPVMERVEEPAWDIAKLFPNQGEWSEEEYLALDTNHLVEFTNGYIEVLPMPTIPHQRLVFFFQRMLWAFVVEHQLGEVLAAPLRVRLRPRKYREPDVVFIRAEKLGEQGIQYWENVDLVMEVVSPDDPDRDYKKKRKEYAQVGIAEYWIVDPMKQVITVLTLDGEMYAEHGAFKPGTQATSVFLPGFTLDVTEVFGAAQ